MEGALALSLAAYLLPLRRLYQGSQKPKYPPLAPNLPLKQTLSTLGLHSFWKQQFHSSHCSAQSLGVILDSFCWYNTYSTHESQPSTARTCPLVTTPMKVISPPTPLRPPTPHPTPHPTPGHCPLFWIYCSGLLCAPHPNPSRYYLAALNPFATQQLE